MTETEMLDALVADDVTTAADLAFTDHQEFSAWVSPLLRTQYIGCDVRRLYNDRFGVNQNEEESE